MPEEVRLWRIEGGDNLREITRSPLDLEARLEVWIERDISILSEGLLVVGRQVPTDFGGFIDLLCLDQSGDVVVVELKRDKTPRELALSAFFRRTRPEVPLASTEAVKSLPSLIPQESNSTDGLRFQLYFLRLRNVLNVSEEKGLDLLPSRREPWIYYGSAGPDYEGFQGFFANIGEIDRLLVGFIVTHL